MFKYALISVVIGVAVAEAAEFPSDAAKRAGATMDDEAETNAYKPMKPNSRWLLEKLIAFASLMDKSEIPRSGPDVSDEMRTK